MYFYERKVQQPCSFVALLASQRFWRQHFCLFLPLLLGVVTRDPASWLFNLAPCKWSAGKLCGSRHASWPDNVPSNWGQSPLFNLSVNFQLDFCSQVAKENAHFESTRKFRGQKCVQEVHLFSSGVGTFLPLDTFKVMLMAHCLYPTHIFHLFQLPG